VDKQMSNQPEEVQIMVSLDPAPDWTDPDQVLAAVAEARRSWKNQVASMRLEQIGADSTLAVFRATATVQTSDGQTTQSTAPNVVMVSGMTRNPIWHVGPEVQSLGPSTPEELGLPSDPESVERLRAAIQKVFAEHRRPKWSDENTEELRAAKEQRNDG
jgi:hypothetical protein